MNQAPRHTAPDASDDFREAIDGTPTAVAVIGIAAIALLAAMKALGFRFSLGVNVGR